ncbi:MAG: response regulator transcription factor [Clostridiales bacterium]|nr:response regulator transcription factor [Clostridiales bacterium]
MYKILIVEDDGVIASAVAAHLHSWGWETSCVVDFQHVMEAFAAFSPHLVLLDITLPFYDGYHWCAEIRKVSKAPVVFLSSAADNMNIVMAMTLGADDFIAKPFDLAVLTAKIQALLRRSYDFAGQVPVLGCRGVLLNTGDGTLTYEGNTLELSKNEFRILQMLLENRGKTVSRDALMTRLWETDSFVDENTLSVNINRLRRRLEAAGIADFIRTKKGIGYLIDG